MAATTEAQLIMRIIKCCIREKLLPYTLTNNVLIVDLKKSSAIIIIKQAREFALSKFQFKGEMLLQTGSSTPITLNNIHHFLKLIYTELADYTTLKQWNSFVAEITNCLQNYVLVNNYHSIVSESLREEFIKSKYKYFIQFIKSHYEPSEQMRFFEKWSMSGHPYHPCHKTKLGFTEAEYTQFSNEFGENVPLYLALLHKSLIHLEHQENNFEYLNWFASNFPNQWENGKKRLIEMKLSGEAYYPLFIHPWQHQNIILKLFAELIQEKKLIVFNDINLTAQPSISCRTLISEENIFHPHIKLPLSIQATSVPRFLSPCPVENGPKLSKILEEILSKEHALGNSLKIASEFCGLHIKDDYEVAKNLSIIYRENPLKLINKGELLLVVAALFENIPLTQKPLLIEISELAIKNTDESILDYFSKYAEVVIKAFFKLYLIYGISLEGHQQNTFVVFKDFFPHYVIVRDLAGIKFSPSILGSRNYHLQPYPDSSTVAKGENELINTFLHTVIQSHLGEVLLIFCQYYNLPEALFWKIIRTQIVEQLNLSRSEVEESRWLSVSNSILENDWHVRGLMRMRLKDISFEDIYVTLKNPLVHEFPAES
jgi:siderophore synthetase component